MEIFIALGNHELFLSESITSILIVAIVLIVLALVVNSKLKKASINEAPTGFLNAIEAYLDIVNGLVESTMGKRNMVFAPYIFTLFSLLILSNISGLVGLTAPTSNYSVTLTLALVTFFMVQVIGIKSSGGLFKYLKGFFEPFALLSPLNIIGELANPVSLSFRLFGNILSGGLIMALLNSALGMATPLIAPVFQIYFDIFSGILQAFIFVMLTMVFVSGARND